MSIYDQAFAGMALTADWLNRHLPQVIVKSADQQIINQGALQDITDLSFAAVAGAEYLIFAHFTYSATTATTSGRDIDFDVAVPSGAAIVRKNIAYDDSAADGANGLSTGRKIIMRQRASATRQEVGGTGPTNFNSYQETCYLQMGVTAGTVQWQFAQNVSAPATEATVRAKSHLMIWRTA